MKLFLFRLVALLLAVAAGFLSWQNTALLRRNAALRETVTQLESERRALEQRLATPAIEKPEERAELRRAIEQQTSELRGLSFQHPVTYKSISRAELRAVLVEKIREQYTEEQARDYGRSFEALGVIPPGTDLMKLWLSLYDEQVGAFYVPEERALYTFKDRGTSIFEARRYRVTIPNAPAPRPVIPGAYGPFLQVPGGVNTIDEDRFEPFVKFSGDSGPLEWEFGVRYQYTDVQIEDFTLPAGGRDSDNDYGTLLPSGHLLYNLDEDRRLSFSIARTARRPGFDQISPALLTGELGDNDLLGNPDLDPEDAWGLDLGFEQRLGSDGIVGVNLFYRDIKDLIEIANTGIEGDDGPGSFVLTPRNTGDGEVWGAELDLSTPLSAFGMNNTGVFFNYSWLDSEIDDLFGTRRFNDQSNYVFNLGFIQELPQLAASFGVTYREQGDAFGRIVGEEVRTSYDGDLEAFVEKRLGEQWTLRLTGSNLLDASKDEIFDKFNSIQGQLDRDYDEFEIETETGGRVYQLMFRYAF